MADIPGVLSFVASATSNFGPLIGDAQSPFALIESTQRIIGTLLPHVTVEEIHHDEEFITLHPVETGSPITDHSFLMPYTVEMKVMWSDSTAQSVGYVEAVYQALLALQQSRQPFNVTTGKRQYSNMLMRSLLIHTNEQTEWALDCVALCQQIIISNSTTAGTTSSSSPTNGTQALNGTSGYSQPSDPQNYLSGSTLMNALPTQYPTISTTTANVGSVSLQSTAYSP